MKISTMSGLLVAVSVGLSAGAASANVGIAGGAPGCPFPTIADAFAASSPGATLLIGPGNYFENLGTISSAVTLSAADATCTTQVVGGVSILPGNDRFAEVNGTNVEVFGLIFRGGEASQGGTFMVRGGGVLRVRDSELRDGRAHENGGGCIFAEGNSEVRIEGKSVLHNCQAFIGNGGAVHVRESRLWVLEDTLMEANGTRLFDDQGEGGAIFGDRAQIYVGDQTVLSQNDANGGGAICATHSDVTITDNAEIGPDNSARHGGGIALQDDTNASAQLRMIASSRVFGNEAEERGGGVYASGNQGLGVLIANDAIVELNTSGDLGGGIFIEQAALALVDQAQILENSAQYGGGVAVLGTNSSLGVVGLVNAEGATLANNVAEVNGGGLLVQGGAAVLINSKITSNIAGQQGGGVYLSGNSASVVMDSDFERCTPMNLPANTYCSEIRANEADEGGGVYVGDANLRATVELNHTAVLDNVVQRGGGGVFVASNSYATLTETLVAGNVNPTGVGGALEIDGDLAVRHVTVTDNLARGLFLNSSGVLAGRSSILFGNPGGNHVDGSGYLRESIRSYQITGSVAITEINVSTQSPQFLPTTRGDYRLGPSSPALDAAPVFASTDLDDVGRPFNDQNDIGCFEWVAP